MRSLIATLSTDAQSSANVWTASVGICKWKNFPCRPHSTCCICSRCIALREATGGHTSWSLWTWTINPIMFFLSLLQGVYCQILHSLLYATLLIKFYCLTVSHHNNYNCISLRIVKLLVISLKKLPNNFKSKFDSCCRLTNWHFLKRNWWCWVQSYQRHKACAVALYLSGSLGILLLFIQQIGT